MSSYSRGANFERRICRWYEEQGAETIRSAGSHGLCDAVAFFPTHIVLNTLRIDGYWQPIERELFNGMLRLLRLRGLPYVGRYVWRGDKKDGYKIHFKDVV